MCPSVLRPGSEIGVCAELCNSDDDCALDEKCCSNGCGHQCTKGVLCAVSVHCLVMECSAYMVMVLKMAAQTYILGTACIMIQKTCYQYHVEFQV